MSDQVKTLPTRRERKKSATRQVIYEAALELFRTRGYLDTPVDAIVDLADVAKGTFFNHFPSKDHVLVQYHRELLTAALEHARSLIHSDKAILERFDAHFQLLASQQTLEDDLFRILVSEVLTKPALTALNHDKVMEIAEVYGKLLELGKQRSEIRADVDTVLAVDVITCLWPYTLIMWAHGQRKTPPADLMAQKLALVFSGISTQ
ncbi:MAG: TetR/AcrR family transcriptional regulator [Deinococcota bacterium]